MTFCASESSGVVANASSRTVSSFAATVSCGRNPIVALFSIVIWPVSGDASPRISENNVDLPAPFGPTNPMRSPRLTCSETSSKTVRPLKDLPSWETVSIRRTRSVHGPWARRNSGSQELGMLGTLAAACASSLGSADKGVHFFGELFEHYWIGCGSVAYCYIGILDTPDPLGFVRQ